MAIEVRTAGAGDWSEVQRLVRSYLASLPFEVDFQDVDAELADLRGTYGPPGGRALLAWQEGRAVGVVGIRGFSGDAAELKRMYVEPGARGSGAGRRLATAAVDAARDLGYRRLLLDTVDTMAPAIALYESLGFVAIEPYRHNPLPGARYFGLEV